MANNFAAIIQKVYSDNLQTHLREEFVGKQIANTKFDWKFIGADTVNFPRQAKLVIGTLTDFNQNLTEQDVTTSNETFVLDQIRYFAYRLNITDSIETYIDPKHQTYIDVKEGFADEMDKAIFGQYQNAGYTIDDGNLETASNGGAGNPIIWSKDNVYDLITAINEVLDEASVPSNSRFVVFSPKEKRLLNKSPFLTRSTADWDKTVRKGFMGEVDSTKVLWSNNLQSAGGTKHVLAGQGMPVSFASNLKPQVFVGSIADSQNFTYQVKGATKFGVKTFTEGSERLIDVHVQA